MFRPLVLAAALLVACGSDPPPTATAPTATSAQMPGAMPVAPTGDAGAPMAETPAPADTGLGNIGTLGSPDAAEEGFRNGDFRLGGTTQGRKAPTLRQGQVIASGNLSQDVIARIMRQNFGRFRLCYENGLQKSPSLEGVVTVKIVIDEKGATKSAVDNGSTLPDASVVACIVKGYAAISYPAPSAGIVTATSPIVLSHGTP